MNKEELTTLPAQGTSHCSCLEHCLLFLCASVCAPLLPPPPHHHHGHNPSPTWAVPPLGTQPPTLATCPHQGHCLPTPHWASGASSLMSHRALWKNGSVSERARPLARKASNRGPHSSSLFKICLERALCNFQVKTATRFLSLVRSCSHATRNIIIFDFMQFDRTQQSR